MDSMFPHLGQSRPLVVLDLETTGLSPCDARIVEFAALKLQPGAKPRMYQARVNPGQPIPPAATSVHSITDLDVRNKPGFLAHARQLANFFDGADLAGFNLTEFDLPVLTCEFERCGVAFSLKGRAVLDARRIYTRKEPRTLAAAVRFYTGRELLAAHSAAADAWAAAEVLNTQLRRYPDLPADPSELHRSLYEVDVGGRLHRGADGQPAMGFGRYRGVPLAEVAGHDAGYLEWLLTTDLLDDASTLIRRALEGMQEFKEGGAA